MNQAQAVASRMSRRSGVRRGEWILIALSVVFALGAMEVVARIMFPAPAPWLYPQIRYRADPALVFSLVPNQAGFTADQSAAINERGFRGPVVPYARTQGATRILFLGDSITFGYGVEERDGFTNRTADLLAQHGLRTETINSAVPSYNSEQEITFLKNEGFRYKPDWVVVGICWNDINEKNGVRVSRNGALIEEASDDTSLTGRLWDSRIGFELRNLVKRSRLLYSAMRGLRAVSGGAQPESHDTFRSDVLAGRDSEKVSRGWTRMQADMHRLAQLSKQYGFRPLLVAFPMSLSVDGTHPHSAYPARLKEIAQREQLPMIDLHPIYQAQFKGHESLFLAYDADHPNAAGHLLAAQAVADYIKAALPVQ